MVICMMMRILCGIRLRIRLTDILANTMTLVKQLSQIEGVSCAFESTYFHEAVLKLNKPASEVLAALAEKNILGGYDLSESYPELGNAILVCATEMRTEEEITAYANVLAEVNA